MNDEFVGMTEYVTESFHDLLMEESESPSDSDSSRGSHHPSRECFMAGTPEGYIKSIHEGGAAQRMTSTTRSRGMQGPHLTYGYNSTRSLKKHDSSLSKNARSSSERSSAMDTMGVRVPWPAM